MNNIKFKNNNQHWLSASNNINTEDVKNQRSNNQQSKTNNVPVDINIK